MKDQTGLYSSVLVGFKTS